MSEDHVSVEVICGFDVHQCPLPLQTAVDELGRLSRDAQGLNRPVTSLSVLEENPNQLLYVLFAPSEDSRSKEPFGILKVGNKKLFVMDKDGQQKEVFPLCILDFYIHEKYQRCGYGKVLFDHFLQVSAVPCAALAIDRPSFKFLNFLSKHYNLNSAIPQCNNFVIFNGFFQYNEVVKSRRESDQLAERCWTAGTCGSHPRKSVTTRIADCLTSNNECTGDVRPFSLRQSPNPVMKCETLSPLPPSRPVSGLHHSPLW